MINEADVERLERLIKDTIDAEFAAQREVMREEIATALGIRRDDLAQHALEHQKIREWDKWLGERKNDVHSTIVRGAIGLLLLMIGVGGAIVTVGTAAAWILKGRGL